MAPPAKNVTLSVTAAKELPAPASIVLLVTSSSTANVSQNAKPHFISTLSKELVKLVEGLV